MRMVASLRGEFSTNKGSRTRRRRPNTKPNAQSCLTVSESHCQVSTRKIVVIFKSCTVPAKCTLAPRYILEEEDCTRIQYVSAFVIERQCNGLHISTRTTPATATSTITEVPYLLGLQIGRKSPSMERHGTYTTKTRKTLQTIIGVSDWGTVAAPKSKNTVCCFRYGISASHTLVVAIYSMYTPLETQTGESTTLLFPEPHL